MKLLSSFIMTYLLYLPLLYAQEVTTVEDIFPDYELSWHVEDTSAKGWVYIGEDYFGISTPFYKTDDYQGDFVYKHYSIHSKKGKLVWTSEDLDFQIFYIEVSRHGNRIIFHHDTGIDFYDEMKNHLFYLSTTTRLFKSSFSGDFFFSKPSMDGANELLILNMDGNEIYKEKIALPVEGFTEGIENHFIAGSITDCLFIYNLKQLIIKDIVNGMILKKKWFQGNTIYSYSYYSHELEMILLWSDKDISVFDINLNMLSNFNVDKNSFIQLVQITDDSKFLILIAYENSQCYFMVYKIDGTLIDQIEYNLPDGEGFSYFAGMSTLGELDVNDNIIIHRYTGRNRITKEKLRYRSTIFTLDSETKKTAAQFTINSWLYHTINDDKFRE